MRLNEASCPYECEGVTEKSNMHMSSQVSELAPRHPSSSRDSVINVFEHAYSPTLSIPSPVFSEWTVPSECRLAHSEPTSLASSSPPVRPVRLFVCFQVEVGSVVLAPQELAMLSWAFSSLAQKCLPCQVCVRRAWRQ